MSESHFKKSPDLPGMVLNAVPTSYHLQGRQFARGDARRTMSRSELQGFAVCPRKWLRAPAREATNAMEFGSLVDCLVTTPALFDSTYILQPEVYSTTGMQCPTCGSVTDSKKCAKCKCERVETPVEKPWSNQSETCQAWIAEQEQSGRTVIRQMMLSAAHKAKSRLSEDKAIAAILEASQKQVQINVLWHDVTGIIIPVKCMLDLVPTPESQCGDTLWDLKEIRDASPQKWARQVFSDQLHYQAALYLDAFNAATGEKRKRFGFISQENTDPYEPTHRLLSEEFLTMGRAAYRQDLANYCWCLKHGEWPGYDTETIEPEAWMLK